MPPHFKRPTESASWSEGWWRLVPLLCALALPCVSSSCAPRSPKRPATPPASPVTVPAAVTTETRIGVVRAIGADQRFVLIETSSALASSSLSEGQLLHCRPPGSASLTATAELRVSRERRQSLIVANVLSGEPAAGDIVLATFGAAPTPTPSPDSISTVSTAPLPSLFPRRTP